MSKTPLAITHPDLAAAWCTEKNGDLTPWQVTAGSSREVWWQCSDGHALYQWPYSIVGKTTIGTKCPVCSGYRAVAGFNDLGTTHPDLAAEWCTEKNKPLTPQDVMAKSRHLVWWECSNGHDSYTWQIKVCDRVKFNSPCPVCDGKKIISGFNDLGTTHPDLAAEWCPEKNKPLTPQDVGWKSTIKVWWECNKDPAWAARVKDRVNGQLCPKCSKRKVMIGVNDLGTTHPDLAKLWHPDKNDPLTPQDVRAGSSIEVWWKCKAGHEWHALPNDITGGRKASYQNNSYCPYCTNRRVLVGYNDLNTTHQDLVSEQWNYAKNTDVSPQEVTSGSTIKVWWKCEAGHEWLAPVRNRAEYNTTCGKCPRHIDEADSLAATHPDLKDEWYTEKNGSLKPEQVKAGSNRVVWWKCKDLAHPPWLAMIKDRAKRHQGCAMCNGGWTDKHLLMLVEGMISQAHMFTDAEVLTIAEVAKLSKVASQRLLQLLRQPQLGHNGTDDTQTCDECDQFDGLTNWLSDGDLTGAAVDGQLPEDDSTENTADSEELEPTNNDQLIDLSADQVLDAVAATPSCVWDDEAALFIVASQVAKLWAAAYADLDAVRHATEEPRDNKFAERVRAQFRSELDAAEQLDAGPDWAFAPDGQPAQPNLMQRHVAAMVRDHKVLGNWSDTGTGKTAAAVLAARTCRSGFDGGLVLVICPNNVIDGWKETILGCYPRNTVVDVRSEPDSPAPAISQRWRVVNYETFSQKGTQQWVQRLLDQHRVDMLIIDEVHLTKKRGADTAIVSQRRSQIQHLRQLAAQANPDLRVLASSATPVINDLSEAVSLLEMLCGVEMNINTTPCVSNAIAVHRQLVLNGVRWRQDKSVFGHKIETLVQIDAGHLREQLVQLSGQNLDIQREQILLDAKLDTIVEQCKRGGRTLIYTYYVDGVVDRLRQTLEAEGIKTAEFSGSIKQMRLFTGVDNTGGMPIPMPERERATVLIGTPAVSLGIDGLQNVADRVVFATLPWTHAEYEQVVGRLWRQGRRLGDVEVILPICSIRQSVDGEITEWSSCRTKWARVRAKGALAAAAIDGKRPNKGELASPAQVTKHLQAWLQRLQQQGAIVMGDRPPLDLVPEPVAPSAEPSSSPLRRFGELSSYHSRWHNADSSKTHAALQRDPSPWHRYHELRNRAKENWDYVPAHVFATWLMQRHQHSLSYAVADLGCGDGALARYLHQICPDHRHRIVGFDHVAVDQQVAGCSIKAADIAQVPLDDGSMDVAVLSLALWGSNYMEYLHQARRILRIDGQLWLAEPTSRIGDDRDAITETLRGLGFTLIEMEVSEPFVVLQAMRSSKPPIANPRPLIQSEYNPRRIRNSSKDETAA